MPGPTRRTILGGLGALAAGPPAWAGEDRYAAARERPPLSDPGFFPIGVWLQNPAHARAYRSIGVNTYVALWKGPTPGKLRQLRAAGMHAIVRQTPDSLDPEFRDTVIAWFLRPDEPDNAQPKKGGEGYDPPVPPEEMARRYAALKRRDRSRPVYLNLGQGVAWDGWVGRGPRTGHPEDYPAYLEAADIASFDIYPVTSTRKPVAGRLELIGRGIERLHRWADRGQGIWAVIGASGIHNPARKPSPAEIRAQVWMAVVHGAEGVIYFVHQFKPRFNDNAVLDDRRSRRAVMETNRELLELAPMLKLGRALPAPARETPAGADALAIRALAFDGAVFLLCISKMDGPLRARIALPEGAGGGVDLRSGARVAAKDGAITLVFDRYEPRLIRIG